MKKFFKLNHPGFFVFAGGIFLIFLHIWFPERPFWSDTAKYSDKVFNTWFTLSQVGIGVGIAMVISGFLWIRSGENKGK